MPYVPQIIKILASPLAIGDFLAHLLKLTPEVGRKLVHVTGGVVAASLPIFMTLEWIGVLMASAAVILTFSRRYSFPDIVYGIHRRGYGDLLFPIGIGFAAVLANSVEIYIASVLALGLGDAASSIVGRISPVKWPLSPVKGKTVTGTVAMTVVIFGIFWVVFGFSWALVAIAVAISLIEAISPYGHDNLSIPVSAALLLNYFS